MLILVCFSFFKTVIEAKDYEGVAGLWGSNCINAELLIKTGLSTKVVKNLVDYSFIDLLETVY